MYLYLIIGAIIVMYKEVFSLITYLVTFLYKVLVFIVKNFFIQSSKGVWYVAKQTQKVTYRKIKNFDTYMTQQR